MSDSNPTPIESPPPTTRALFRQLVFEMVLYGEDAAVAHLKLALARARIAAVTEWCARAHDED